MSDPISERVNTTETGDETRSPTGHESGGVNNDGSYLSSPVTSEEVARQIKAATDPLTKQFERLCDIMKELRQAPSKRNEETAGLIQRSSRAPAIGSTHPILNCSLPSST